MNAKVVRRQSDRVIEAMGPDTDNYAPWYDPALHIYGIEEYTTALTEYASYPKPPSAIEVLRTDLQDASTLAGVKAAFKKWLDGQVRA